MVKYRDIRQKLHNLEEKQELYSLLKLSKIVSCWNLATVEQAVEYLVQFTRAKLIQIITICQIC